METVEVERLKARMILGQMGGAPGGQQNVAASPMATPPFGVQMKQAPMQGKPQGVGGPPMPPPVPTPKPGGPGAPPPNGMVDPNANKPQPQGAMQPQPPATAKPQERPESKREREVRKSLENLRGVIMEIAATVYQMPLTEEQVRDLAYKLLEEIAERISEITVERVSELGRDLIGEILTRKKYE